MRSFSMLRGQVISFHPDDFEVSGSNSGLRALFT